MSGNSTGHIIQSLVMNAIIAIAKGTAAVFTGSAAMIAESIHTGADCCNQLLLLLGVKQSGKAPTASHPLGYGRALYFWSFMVALFLFLGGGVFSIYEGLHKIEHPEPVELVWVGLGILLFSLALEGWATLSNIKEMNIRRAGTPFLKYLRQTKDSDLVVVFGENLAASLGLMIAIPALTLAWATGNSAWDGVGSLGIGIVLVGVSVFLAAEIRSLLLGESADTKVESAAREIVAAHPAITKLLHMITLQQGPGQVLLLVKLGFNPELKIEQVCDAINTFETDLRSKCPEIRWCFVEPDRPRA